MDKLPKEIILEILFYIEIKEYFQNFRYVNKYFLTMMDDLNFYYVRDNTDLVQIRNGRKYCPFIIYGDPRNYNQYTPNNHDLYKTSFVTRYAFHIKSKNFYYKNNKLFLKKGSLYGMKWFKIYVVNKILKNNYWKTIFADEQIGYYKLDIINYVNSYEH